MMAFRKIKSALIDDVLGPASGINYRVIGYQTQAQSGNEVKNNNRSAEVYYSSGTFPQERQTGPNQHKTIFRIDLTVSAPATVDLSVINDSGSTPAEIQAALAAMSQSGQECDDLMDELFDLIYQTIMDGRNNQLKLDENGSGIVIANRKITDFRKDQPLPRGEFVILTANIELSVKVAEEVPGFAGPEAEGIETVQQFADQDENIDTESKAGVEVVL